MTWTVNLGGHDDMAPDAKEAFENQLVESVQQFIADLKEEEGVVVSTAYVTTNSTGQVDLLEEEKAAVAEEIRKAHEETEAANAAAAEARVAEHPGIDEEPQPEE